VATDEHWDAQARHETPTERLDRNWADLLQEVRVVQTGVQVLAAFLLTLPFQARFSLLTGPEKALYLSTVGAAVGAVAFLIAPVALHRTLFRQHARQVTVATAHRLALTGILLFALAVVGAVWLIFEVVAGVGVGVTAAAIALALLVILWLSLPLYLRRSPDRPA